MGCIREQGRDGADYDFLAQNNFDYMIQRPKDGTIIVGGGRWKVSVENLIGNTDDSVKIPDLTEYLRLYIAIHGDHEGGNASAHTSRMSSLLL